MSSAARRTWLLLFGRQKHLPHLPHLPKSPFQEEKAPGAKPMVCLVIEPAEEAQHECSRVVCFRKQHKIGVTIDISLVYKQWLLTLKLLKLRKNIELLGLCLWCSYSLKVGAWRFGDLDYENMRPQWGSFLLLQNKLRQQRTWICTMGSSLSPAKLLGDVWEIHWKRRRHKDHRISWCSSSPVTRIVRSYLSSLSIIGGWENIHHQILIRGSSTHLHQVLCGRRQQKYTKSWWKLTVNIPARRCGYDLIQEIVQNHEDSKGSSAACWDDSAERFSVFWRRIWIIDDTLTMFYRLKKLCFVFFPP